MRTSGLPISWLVLAMACGGEGGDDGASTGGTTDASGSSGGSSVTMPTSSMSETADSGSSGGGGSSESGVGTSSGGSGGSSSSETGATGCAALDQVACGADETCHAVLGSPYVMMNDTFCLGQREFIECQDAMACGDALTHACENKDTTVYVFGDTCIPTGWMDCAAPVEGAKPC